MSTDEKHRQYWRANLKLLSVLLAVWFLFSCVLPIIMVDKLNAIQIPSTGFPLGFWIAQQGSIVVFIILILIYALGMRKIDRKFGLVEKEESK